MKTAEIIDFQSVREEVYENCVICNRLTDVRKDTDINDREYYINGIGQVDQKCYEEVYSFKNNEKREGLISKLMKILRGQT